MDLQTLLSRGLVRPTDFYDCGMKLVFKGAVVIAQLIYQSLTTLNIHSSNLPKSSIEKEKRKKSLTCAIIEKAGIISNRFYPTFK